MIGIGLVMHLKTCSKCRESKPLSDFHKLRSSKDGLQRYCKDCRKIHNAVWKSQNKDYFKKYYLENYSDLATVRYINKDAAARRASEWRKNNPEKYDALKKISDFRRKSRLKNAFVEHIDKYTLYKRDKGFCGICGDLVAFQEASVDHIIPISLGGMHSYKNTQLAHLACNLRKGARYDSEIDMIDEASL